MFQTAYQMFKSNEVSMSSFEEMILEHFGIVFNKNLPQQNGSKAPLQAMQI